MENNEMLLLFLETAETMSRGWRQRRALPLLLIATQNNLPIVTWMNRRTAERLLSGTKVTYPLLFVSAPAKDYCDKIQTFKGS